MGCSGSKDMSLLATLRQRFPKTLSILELQQYSKRLAEQFLEADGKGLLALDYNEFLKMCKLPKNRVTQRLFALCDMDGSGTLDFREMCYAVWQICTLDHRGLTQMLFDLYDEYNNGAIEYDDVERMLGDGYGTANLGKEEMQAMVEYVKKRLLLTRQEFVEFCDRSPQVLKQIVDVQRSVRARVLGTRVWEQLTRRRNQKTDPAFRPENWAALMERIIVMDIDSRAEQERMLKALERKLGRRVKRVNVRGAGGNWDDEGAAKIKYEA